MVVVLEIFGFLVRKGVDDLLRCPFGIGVVGRVEVDDLPPVVAQRDEHVQYPKSNRGNGKEITGSDVGNMIIQERSPRLRRGFSEADHVLGYGPFRNGTAQQKQYCLDDAHGVLPEGCCGIRFYCQSLRTANVASS